jgi:hypothetical protein
MAPTGIKKAGNVDNGAISPEEAARIRASVASKEQAPSVQAQTQLFGGWRQAADTLGSPFEVERIPLSKLHAMRRDPMLAFGLSFIKTPHVRAKWHIDARGSEGPNAQVAAHLDHDLRLIYGQFVSGYLNSLDYGFQAMAKRFVEQENIAGTFIETNPDTGEQEEKPIWSEGGVNPIGWKPFVTLPPDIVEPIWQSGEFNGIAYSTEGGQQIAGIAPAAGSATNKITVDLYHSLWVTNERESNFGRLWGYPRLGYAYRYWWSYWFLWTIRDRAFERKIDPSIKVFHPEGEFFDDQTGESVAYRDYALTIADRIRSGGAIAVPSEPWEDINGRGTIRKWDLEYVTEAVDFKQFDSPLEDMQVQKLRSLWIPELAFIEGGGGTSSRNVAKELGSSFVESQAVLSQQIAEHINRWVIPQWLAVNYSEFMEQGGEAKIVIQGFTDEDTEFTTQLVNLIGQQEGGQQELMKLVELEEVLRGKGIPINDFATQQRRQAEIEEAAAAAQAPTATATAGGTGVLPTAFGTSYYNSPEQVHFSSAGTEFVEGLPNTKHYEDKAIKGFSRQLHNAFRQLLNDEYEQAATAVLKSKEKLELSDEQVELSKATDILKAWKDSKRWPQAISRAKEIMKSILKRSIRNELKTIKDGQMPDEDTLDKWVNDRLEKMIPKIANTTREEVAQFVATQLREGVTDKAELSSRIREHFTDFPTWKASRIARTETRDVFNAGTLLAAEESGLKRVQALDGLKGDTDEHCENRDGEIFTISAAWKEDEHPNGTLAWRPVPAELAIQYETRDNSKFDEENLILHLSDQITPEAERAIKKRVVDKLYGI